MPRYRNDYAYALYVPDAGQTVEPGECIDWDGPSLGAHFVEVVEPAKSTKPAEKSAETKENGQ